MSFDVEGARKYYSDAEIAEHLAAQSGFNLAGARKHYSDADIIKHLNGGGSEPSQASTPVAYSPKDVDRDTGAGWKERFSIGSATSAKDKLARARAFYGDDAHYEEGTDNILFMNPKTKKWTQVNPNGFDMGDLFGGGREIASTVASIPTFIGGTIGSGLNPVLGLAASSAAGAGTGVATDLIAEQMARNAAEKRGKAKPERVSVGQHLKDAALETALGTAGGVVLGKAGSLIKKTFNPTNPAKVAAYAQEGIAPSTIGEVIDGKLPVVIENAVSRMPGGFKIMEKARDKSARQLQDLVEKKALAISGGKPVAQTVPELGSQTHAFVDNGTRAWKAASDKAYGNFEAAYGGMPVGGSNLADEILRQAAPLGKAQAKETIGRLAKPVRSHLKDARDGSLTVTGARRTRTSLNLPDSPLATTMPVSSAEKGLLRDAITSDIIDALPAAGARKLTGLDKAYKIRKKAGDYVESVFTNGKGGETVADETLGKRLTTPSTLTTKDLDNLERVVGRSKMSQIAAGILKNSTPPAASLGLAPDMASPNAIARVFGLGNKGAFSPEVQKKLFGKNLDNLRTIAESQSRFANLKNHSNTAMYERFYDLIGNAPAAIAAPFAGGAMVPFGFLGGLGGVTAPYLVAKTVTSPKVIKYLSKPQSKFSKMALGKGAKATGMKMGQDTANLLRTIANSDKGEEGKK